MTNLGVKMALIINTNSPTLTTPPTFFTGESDFENYIHSHYTYIDKTRFIKKWLESGNKITLIVRPRRFFKTTTLSMVDKWFNCTHINTLFQGTEILSIATPTMLSDRENLISIFITLKNIDAKSLHTLLSGLKQSFRRVFFEYEEIYSEYVKNYGEKLGPEASAKDQIVLITNEFVSFIEYLAHKLKVKFIILIDEYDKILMDAADNDENEKGYFNIVLDIYRNFLNSLLKDTWFVERAILTGVLPLAANSVFSAFNNSIRDTFFNNLYEDIFGFTFDEIKVLTGWMSKEEDARMLDLLDSYNSGTINVINPWSLINYIKNEVNQESSYSNNWVLTGNSDWIRYRDKLTNEELEKVSALLVGESLTVPLNHELSYLDRSYSLSNYLTYAFYTGYLTFEEVTSDTVSLRIPNKEVLNAWLANIDLLIGSVKLSFNWSDILESLNSSAASEQELEQTLQTLLEECASTWDVVDKENSYHMWILGLMTSLVGTHKVTSNREAGLGRFDIAVTPLTSRKVLRNYVFELKKSNNANTMITDTIEAIEQVKRNKYYQYFDNRYDIVIIGLAAFKKNIKVKIEVYTREQLMSLP
ncbi:ATP-binding protein [Paenibacillus hunanensis]|uniref:AAA family ATPase n=1 Tax=Paenibacillus hunanensis TaxID=539262 RepID=UPI0020260D5A|nr:AAA family ATPase [Paenibacillus hunanensis]MCL9662055.1 ATP-binding protein [Paenibacillus hunanensis]